MKLALARVYGYAVVTTLLPLLPGEVFSFGTPHQAQLKSRMKGCTAVRNRHSFLQERKRRCEEALVAEQHDPPKPGQPRLAEFYAIQIQHDRAVLSRPSEIIAVLPRARSNCAGGRRRPGRRTTRRASSSSGADPDDPAPAGRRVARHLKAVIV